MKTNNMKPTLKLRQKSIEKAKAYAKSRKKSLARPEEKCFDSVKKLSGVAHLKKGADEKKLYADYLADKYSKSRTA